MEPTPQGPEQPRQRRRAAGALALVTALVVTTAARAEPQGTAPASSPAAAAPADSAAAPPAPEAPAPAPPPPAGTAGETPASAPAIPSGAAPQPPAAPYPYYDGYPYPYPYAAPPEPPPAPPLRFSSEAEIPPEEEGQFEPGAHRRVNTAKAGKILMGVGLGLAVVGGLLTAAIATGDGPSSDDLGYGQAVHSLGLGFGVGMLVTGGVGLLVGIPLYAASPRK